MKIILGSKNVGRKNRREHKNRKIKKTAALLMAVCLGTGFWRDAVQETTGAVQEVLKIQ